MCYINKNDLTLLRSPCRSRQRIRSPLKSPLKKTPTSTSIIITVMMMRKQINCGVLCLDGLKEHKTNQSVVICTRNFIMPSEQPGHVVALYVLLAGIVISNTSVNFSPVFKSSAFVDPITLHKAQPC